MVRGQHHPTRSAHRCKHLINGTAAAPCQTDQQMVGSAIGVKRQRRVGQRMGLAHHADEVRLMQLRMAEQGTIAVTANHAEQAREVADRQIGKPVLKNLLGIAGGQRGQPQIGQHLLGMAECRGLSVVGFRRLLHVVDDGMSQSAGFRRNIAKIGAAGYAYDMVFHARQLGIAEALARACPDQVLVLDHCGNPDVAGDGFDAWFSGLQRMAALPHVWLKFSGMTVNCAPGTASVQLLQRYTDAMLEVFGPARMIWGGDWPVVDLAVGLPDWIDMSRVMLSGLSVDEQAMIGHQNARRVYGLAG